MQSKAINSEMSIGPQPSESDIQELAGQGVKTVINLRVDNEAEDQLSPIDEGQMARDAGMEYLHIPVIGNQIREGQVDEFRNAVDNLPKPIYVHCAKGKRAAVFAVMDEAVRKRRSGKEALARASELGYEVDNANLQKFVKEYIDSRNK